MDAGKFALYSFKPLINCSQKCCYRDSGKGNLESGNDRIQIRSFRDDGEPGVYLMAQDIRTINVDMKKLGRAPFAMAPGRLQQILLLNSCSF